MDLKYAVFALVLLLVYCSAFQETDIEPPYVKFCKRKTCLPVQNNSQVLSYCQRKELMMDGRCCIHYNGTSNITLGMDLSNCGIEELQTEMFAAFNRVEVLMLQNNPFPKFKAMHFVGLTNLIELYLPLLNGTCPGGNESWESIEVQNSVAMCFNEEDTCKSHNLTCPPNAICTTAGPGSATCTCVKDYYGYKCMRTGHFPMLVYTVSSAVGITTLSLFLWLMRRFNGSKV